MRRLILLSLMLGLSAASQALGLGQQSSPRAKAESVAPTTSVRSLYVVHCAGCHGMDGAGTALGRVPDMRRLGKFLRVPGGREFVIQVPGVMGSGLDDKQVAEVTNWVLGTLAKGSMPTGSAPYSATEVGLARAKPLLDVAAARRQLVDLAHAQGVLLD